MSSLGAPILLLQKLTWVAKPSQFKIEENVAESIAKVVTHGLDKVNKIELMDS